jgi:glycosyl-4,4'-diaponeurosporenoate acyltransferase
MPPLHLSDPVTVALDVAVWGAVHAGTGYFVHRLPATTRALAEDRWWSRTRSFERDGRFYEQRFGIKRWKDRVPEAGALFDAGVSKRALPARDRAGLQRFVVETRRAELGHWLAAAAGPLFALWNPPAVAVVMVCYGIGINAPFVAIQRYNRARVARVLRRDAERSNRADTESSG